MTVAALLMVEDAQWPGADVTERLGVALYSRFLEGSPYADLQVLSGRDSDLLGTIHELAAAHDAIDCFLSIHSTARDPETWARGLQGLGPKLRLVYSTACHGTHQEREAWERAGARTVVTFAGVNNPVVALPYFLSHWLDGERVGATVAEAFRETTAVVRYALSLPGLSTLPSVYGVSDDWVAGSQPAVSGDAGLRITDGTLTVEPRVADGLRYQRDMGGPLGLILRALAGRFEIQGEEIHALRDRIKLDVVSPAVEEQLAKVESLSVERAAKLVLRFQRGLRIELGRGLRLTTSRRVSLRPKAFDPSRGLLAVRASGIWVSMGALRADLTELRIQPDAADGYELRASAGLFGVFPLWKTVPIGGSAPK